MGPGELPARPLRRVGAVSLRRRLTLAVLLAVTGHQLALAAGRVTTGEAGVAGGRPRAGVGHGRRARDRGHGGGCEPGRLAHPGASPSPAPDPDPEPARRRHAPPHLGLVTVLALAILLVQENLEHLTQHGHLPLLEPLLSGQYVAVLPVFAGLGLLLAAAGLAIGATDPPARTRRQPTAHRAAPSATAGRELARPAPRSPPTNAHGHGPQPASRSSSAALQLIPRGSSALANVHLRNGPMRRPARLLLIALATLALIAIPAMASAHVELISSSPEAGANLDSAPDRGHRHLRRRARPRSFHLHRDRCRRQRSRSPARST